MHTQPARRGPHNAWCYAQQHLFTTTIACAAVRPCQQQERAGGGRGGSTRPCTPPGYKQTTTTQPRRSHAVWSWWWYCILLWKGRGVLAGTYCMAASYCSRSMVARCLVVPSTAHDTKKQGTRTSNTTYYCSYCWL